MTWTAVVPLKAAADRKTRLAGHLSPAERIALSLTMAQHVATTLLALPDINKVLLLSPPPPEPLGATWAADLGTGLNPELERIRAGVRGGVLIVHADLPLLGSDDLSELISAAQRHGAAIAPDRRGNGTNAVALREGHLFRLAFGSNSFEAHRAQDGCAVVSRPGLAFDIDTIEDLEALRRVPVGQWRT